ncbi:MAG: hypothetical protein ACREJ8_10670 [Candidatus Methylomirabilales bacterium]
MKRITAPVDPMLEIAEILVRCETIDREVPEDGRDVLADEL